jgi:hypothetical protein
VHSDAIVCLVIQIAFGLVGAYIVGNLSTQSGLSLLGITIAGIVGGGLGGQLLGLMLGSNSSLGIGGGLGRQLIALLGGGSVTIATARGRGGLDATAILAQILGGAVGGGLLTLIAAVSRQTADADDE